MRLEAVSGGSHCAYSTGRDAEVADGSRAFNEVRAENKGSNCEMNPII